MTSSPASTIGTSAAALRARLADLRRERALAALSGLDGVAAYMADLDDDENATRAAYVGAAVTEIASLRAAFDGPLHG